MAVLAGIALSEPALADDRRHDNHDNKKYDRHDDRHDNKGWGPFRRSYSYAPIVAYKPVYVSDDVRRSCHFVVDPWGPDVRGRTRGYWTESCYQPVRYYAAPSNGLSLNIHLD